ncbi:putative transporter MCH1 [Grifola frondosa]|uniref:Putative transporter MCH1 n=1 Tax=Grifola frondosa TaxID=5627 RepID=A0A1C7MH67_GRIFR|nr:putative transporter MCH1 [Grifola frondosa]
MKLTQPQLTTIALAGMAGQYPFAALVGKALDRYGPRACSLAASVFFSLGYGLFAWEIANTPDTITQPSASSFRHLVIFFGMIGLGTVLSYFALVFAATKTFAHYIGIASGTSMALFGLSPLLLSVLASKHIHFLSALVLPGPTSHAKPDIAGASSQGEPIPTEEDERSPLLTSSLLVDDTRRSGDHESVASDEQDFKPHKHAVQEPQHGSVLDLLADPHFWVLSLLLTLAVGTAEMVIANLGSIVLSLPASSSATSNVSKQVELLSFFNTMSRLVMGPLADLISPVAAYLHDGVWAFPRKRHTSRIVFLSSACLLLAATFAWLEVGVRSQETIWPLSVGTGIVYGTIFTMLPGILSSIWGLPNLGRNFGTISYTAFVGTTIFSYLYAFVAAQHVGSGEGACKGVQCWRLTFWMSTGAALTAALCSFVLWRKWRARV